MYDFHKTKGDNCFSHSLFHRGMKHIIKNIKRKTGSTEEEAQAKRNSTEQLLSTLNELNKRLEKLEAKEEDYEKLLRDYKEIKDRNKQLEQMLMYFSQSLAATNRNYFKETIPVDTIDPNGNFNSQNLYPSPPIRNLLGDNVYQLGKFNTARLPSMGRVENHFKMIEAPDKYTEEERIVFSKKSSELEGDIELLPQTSSPNLPDAFSIEVTPVELSLSPLNPPLEVQEECEPRYLSEIELSPAMNGKKAILGLGEDLVCEK